MRPLLLAALSALLLAAGLLTAGPALAAGVSYTWAAEGDGTSWTDAANWSPVGVPGPGDDVVVQAPSDDVCHAHVTAIPADTTIANLTVDERLFHGNPDSPCLTSLDDGSITVTGALTFHAGTIDSGLTIPTGATATVGPGAAHDTTALGGPVTVQGAITLAGAAEPRQLVMSGSPGLTVAAGATLTSSGSNDVEANCCLDYTHLTNHGTLAIGSGTLRLDGVGLDQDALLTTSKGGQLVTSTAPQTAGPGARYRGAGAWDMQQGTVTPSGTQNLANGFRWILGGAGTDGGEQLLGRFTLAGSGRFEWQGGTIQAAMTLGRGVPAVVSGATTVAGDDRDLSGQDATTTPPTPLAVTVHSTWTVSGGASVHATNGGDLVVASDGLASLAPGTTFSGDCCSFAPALTNSGGQVVVPSGSGTVRLGVGYQATGGSLTIGSGATVALSTGAPSLLSATSIAGGGTLGVAGPTSVVGASTVAAGTAVRLQAGGSLLGTKSGALTGAGTFGWTAGSLGGTIALATSGGQQISGATLKQVVDYPTGKSSAVTFAGPTTMAAGTGKQPDTVGTADAGTVTFSGALALAGNTEFSGGSVRTAGTTTVDAATGGVDVDGGGSLANSGVFTLASGTLRSGNDIAQSGTMTIAAGAVVRLTLSSGLIRQSAGVLAGAGTVSGSVRVTGGTVAPGGDDVGTLTVTGAYTQTASGGLLLDVANATSYDVLAVGGAATLAGALTVHDVGGFVPASGAQATVVTGKPLSSGIGCVVTTGDGAASQHWTAAVSAHKALVLTSVAGASSC